jgi:hypothetical protein
MKLAKTKIWRIYTSAALNGLIIKIHKIGNLNYFLFHYAQLHNSLRVVHLVVLEGRADNSDWQQLSDHVLDRTTYHPSDCNRELDHSRFSGTTRNAPRPGYSKCDSWTPRGSWIKHIGVLSVKAVSKIFVNIFMRLSCLEKISIQSQPAVSYYYETYNLHYRDAWYVCPA